MINIYLLTIELIICLIVMLLTYKLFKLEGLYVYMISMFILSNIMSGFSDMTKSLFQLILVLLFLF